MAESFNNEAKLYSTCTEFLCLFFKCAHERVYFNQDIFAAKESIFIKELLHVSSYYQKNIKLRFCKARPSAVDRFLPCEMFEVNFKRRMSSAKFNIFSLIEVVA